MRDAFHSRLDAVVARFKHARDPRVQESVELVRSAGADSVAALIKLAADRENPISLRASAAWLLGQLRERSAVPALLRMLTESRDHPVTCEAMKALGAIDDKGSVRPLIALLRSRKRRVDVRMGAAYALGCIGDRRATSAFISILEDVKEDARLRDQVADSMGGLFDSRSIKPLMGALHDPDPGVRASAANSLGQIRAVCALSELKKLTRRSTEPDPDVRRLARWAVASLEEARRGGDNSGKSWRS